MTWRADLGKLSDNALLARLRPLPPDSAERAAICEVLVERYAHLVRACVRPYRRSPEPLEDLTQVGYLGLIKAIGNFDPAFGDSLPAYAAPCISGEIKRHFRDKRWQVHVRRPLQELLLEIRAVSAELAQERGRTPGDDELAALLGVTENDIRDAHQAALAFSASSLDAPLSDDGDAAPLSEMLGQVTPRDLVVVPILGGVGGETVLALIYAHMADDADMPAQVVSDLEALAEAVSRRVARAATPSP